MAKQSDFFPQYYTVVLDEDGIAFFFFRQSSIPVAASDYPLIQHALKRGMRQKELTEMTQKAVYLASKCDWQFPRVKGDMRGVTNCVYFLTHSTRKDEIKIGSAQRLLSGVNAVSKSLPEGVTRVLAFAQHYNFREFVRCLRTYHANVRVSGEWFQAAPVIEFLHQYGYRG